MHACSGIVFANKAVFQTYGFHFTFALTEVHTAFTLVGMLVLARVGMFEMKRIPQARLAQLAAAYVGYIVLCNLSLKVNTVGFYQVCVCVWGGLMLGCPAHVYAIDKGSIISPLLVLVLAGHEDSRCDPHTLTLCVQTGSHWILRQPSMWHALIGDNNA